MDVTWQVLSPNVFLISGGDSRFVLYAPLRGVIMEVNRAFVERFEKALRGDAEAAAALGLDLAVVEGFIQTPASARRQFEPEWPDAFEPTSVTVFLTHKCTLQCAYCYCHGGEGLDMPWPVFECATRFVLANAKKQGREFRLSYHGGDVGACWPLFVESVAFVERECAAAGVKPVLSLGTNGFYSAAQARYIAEHVGEATVSIDGAPDVHDACRATAAGGPSLARTLETVKVLDEHRVPYSVRMTVTDASLPALAGSVEFICRNTRAGTIRAEPLYSRGRAASSCLRPPEPEAFVAAFRAAHDVARRHGRLLAYSGARLTGVFGSFCSYPSPTFGVTPEGNLTCCYEVLHPGDPLRDPFFYGRIPPDGSRIDVDPQRVAAIRAWARQRRDACADCFCVPACAGDCAAKVMDGALPPDETPRRCRITRALVLDLIRAALAGEKLPVAAGSGRNEGHGAGLCACVDCGKSVVARDRRPDPVAGEGPLT